MPSQKTPHCFAAMVYQTITEQQLVTLEAGRIVHPSCAVLEQCAATCYALYRQADNRHTSVERAAHRWQAIHEGIAATSPLLVTPYQAIVLIAAHRRAARRRTRDAILQHC